MKSVLRLMLIFACASSALADDRVIVVEGKPKADLEKSFGLTPYDSGTSSTYSLSTIQANSDLLQARADSPTGWKYPWFIPNFGDATQVNHQTGFALGRTLVLPNRAGRQIVGTGRGLPQGGAGTANGGGGMILHAKEAETIFDGDENVLATAPALDVTGATNTDPIEITAVDHGLVTYAQVVISGVMGNTAANGTFRVTRIDDNTFSIKHASNNDDVDGTDSGVYVQDTGTCLTSKVVATTRVWHASDQFNSLEITGGTNVDLSQGRWFAILDVDVETNTLVLDRMWNTGSVENGTGRYCPEVIQEHGYGLVLKNLSIQGNRTNLPSSNNKQGGIGIHVCTNEQSDNCPTGKTVLDTVAFSGLDFPIVTGPSMVGFTGDSGSPLATKVPFWYGHNHNHADWMETRGARARDCRVFHLATNEQSVCHFHDNPNVVVSDSMIRMESGGRLTVIHPSVSGKTGTQRFVTVRKGFTVHDDFVNITDLTTDANNTRLPQTIVTEWEGAFRSGTFVFNGGTITTNVYKVTTDSATPTNVITVKGYTPSAANVGEKVYVVNLSGDDAVDGIYEITGFSGNTFTLDRDWNDDGEVSGAVATARIYFYAPQFDLASRANCRVSNIDYKGSDTVNGLMPGSIRMMEGTTGWEPRLVLSNVQISTLVSDPKELITTDSNAGWVTFRNCSSITGTHFSDGTWDVAAGEWLTTDGEKVEEIVVTQIGDTLSTGDGQAYFAVPAQLDGWRLSDVYGALDVTSSSGTPEVQLRRNRGGSSVDMLSTSLTIDVGENDSGSAAVPHEIDSSNDDVAAGDRIYFDVDAAGTGAEGLHVVLTFHSP